MLDISLRIINILDLEDFYEISKDEESRLLSGATPCYNLQQAQQLLIKLIDSNCYFAIVNNYDNKVIGLISLRKDPHRYNSKAFIIGYEINKDYRRKGVATICVAKILHHAFINLKADIVSVSHFVENEASKGLIIKCGFTFEGILRREFTRFDGVICDSAMYSMTREEYNRVKDVKYY